MRNRLAHMHLPEAKWPQQDREMWHQTFAGEDDPFGGGGARLSTHTRSSYMFAYRRWLGFLTAFHPNVLRLPPARRFTPERVQSLVRNLQKTLSASSVAGRTAALYHCARLMAPRSDWEWFKATVQRLMRAVPRSRKPQPVITSLQLIETGEKLLKDARSKLERGTNRSAALRYRDGLILTLLGYVPLRAKNLAALELGQHIIQVGKEWFIVINENETKTRNRLEFRIPDAIQPYLEFYVEVVRPMLLAGVQTKAFWVSAHRRRPLGYSGLLISISRHCQRHLGIHVTLHDARDAAATTWAIFAPQHVSIARDLLGHANLRTTIRHYNRANGVTASRTYRDIIASRRRQRV